MSFQVLFRATLSVGASDMGIIRRKRDGRVVFLPNQLIVGRERSPELMLIPSVSATHAILRWRDPEWILVDHGSKNGTFVNGRRIDAGIRNSEVLRAGAEIVFAERGETWTVVDDGPPRPVLIRDDGLAPTQLSEAEIVPLGAEDELHGYLFCESGVWKVEYLSGTVFHLRSGAPFRLGSVTYRIHLPGPAPETPSALTPIAELILDNTSLEIRIASDEEAAAITVKVSGERFELPARSHLYLLAHLARTRLAQLDRDGRSAEGWISVEEACRDLGVATPEALSVTVYRCRKDFEQTGIREPSRLVDRAKRGFLRIGIPGERLTVLRPALVDLAGDS